MFDALSQVSAASCAQATLAMMPVAYRLPVSMSGQMPTCKSAAKWILWIVPTADTCIVNLSLGSSMVPPRAQQKQGKLTHGHVAA